jgi:hypothetical protein
MVPFLLIVLCLLWRTQGGLLFACAMWVLAFLYMRRLPPRLKGLPVAWLTVLLGMLCNAIVTVANGGYMPVAGLPSDVRPLFPTWIPARAANYLVILADQHYLFYFSMGCAHHRRCVALVCGALAASVVDPITSATCGSAGADSLAIQLNLSTCLTIPEGSDRRSRPNYIVIWTVKFEEWLSRLQSETGFAARREGSL